MLLPDPVPPRRFQECVASAIHDDPCDFNARCRRSAVAYLIGYIQPDCLFLSPFHQFPINIFWAAVDADGLQFATPFNDLI